MTEKMTSDERFLRAVTRRYFFAQNGLGLGSLALGALLNGEILASHSSSANPMDSRPPHYPAKAKRIIFLFMAGAPSQLDLLDNKPTLVRLDRQKIPAEIIEGEQFAFIKGIPEILGSPFSFEKYGQSGAEVSELLPHLREVVDDICIVKSLYTDQFNHAPAQIFMNTGHQRIGRPSMGSWLTYGLGSEKQRPARVRSPGLRPGTAGWRQVVLGQRISSHPVSGSRIPVSGGSGPLYFQPARGYI